jgi:hypothetical protein
VSGYAEGPHAYSLSTDLQVLNFNSVLASPFAVLSLLYFPGSNQFASWAAGYRTPGPVLVLLGVLLLAVALTSLLDSVKTGREDRKRPIAVPAGAALLLLTFLFLFGSNPGSPIASGYLWLFDQSTLLQAFLRSPYLTIGNATAFLMAFLFGEGTAVCSGVVARRLAAEAPTPAEPPVGNAAARFRRRLSPRTGLQMTAAVVLVALTMVFAWPSYTGASVTDLDEPASPELPGSAMSLASFLDAHQGDGTTVVLPGSNGLVRENWSSGYLGPPALPFLVGSPVLESFIPPLGSGGNDVVPLALSLPSFNASSGYDHLLQVLGAKFVVVDAAQGGGPPVAPFNLSAINWSLAHQQNVSYVRSFGSYSVYAVNGSAPRIFAPSTLEADSGLFRALAPLSRTFAMGANNSADLSRQGLWSSTTPVARTLASSFEVDAYWPAPNVRSSRGTGFHFPGWPEVTNLPPLGRPIGGDPLVFVNVSGSTEFVPVIWFSTAHTLQEWTGNISAYDRTLNQFFIPPVFAYSFNNSTSTRSYVYDLASLGGGVSLGSPDLNHIMVELQPVGDYWGWMNATVTLDLGGPAFLESSFGPTDTVFAPPAIAAAVADSSRPGPSVGLAFERLDASEYSVQAAATRAPFAVVLLQDYDPHWGITASQGVARTVHFEADGFANGWLIYPTSARPSFRITFSFEPVVLASEVVSTATVAVLVAVPMLLFVRSHLARRRLRKSRSASTSNSNPIGTDPGGGVG